MKNIKVGSDFSGVGAFNQALIRLGIKHEEAFACDMDKYARQTFTLNYGEPKYYPTDVYEREIPKESLDIYMSSPPCQAFSLAGKRKGEEDKRGILFYNTHDFIVKNNPRYFIIENVKGLLSDDSGKTFARWIDLLGGKSVNGNPVLFPHEESAPYHVYFQVLNAKHYGIPQNRERVFIIGVREDADNTFKFPKPFHLTRRLKDVLEKEVDEKYFLSDSNINALIKYNERQIENGTGFSSKFRDVEKVSTMDALKCGGGGKDDLIKIKSATKCGYEIATENDSINFSVLSSETRRGRVGKGVAQTLDTACNQGVIIQLNNPVHSNDRVYSDIGIAPTLNTMQGGNRQPFIELSNEVIQLNPSTESGGKQPYQQNRVYDTRGVMTTLDTDSGKKSILLNQRIRRLTPLECFRLMDFNEAFKWEVSDSQAYKQAGNSICVGVLAAIISKLNF